MSAPATPLRYGGPSSPPPYRPDPGHRWVVFAVIAVAAIGAAAVLIWLWLPRPSYAGRDWWFPLGGFFLVFFAIWLALFAIRLSFLGSRRRFYRGGPGRGFDPAIRIARMRYARGEITRQQFEEIVGRLRPPPPPS